MYVFYRGNDVKDVKEVKKMQCLPLLRALVLSGTVKVYNCRNVVGP